MQQYEGMKGVEFKTHLGMDSLNHPTIPLPGGVHNFQIYVRSKK